MPPASEVVDDDVSEDEDEGYNPPLPLDQLAPTPSKEALFGGSFHISNPTIKGNKQFEGMCNSN
jgi:hypothetical protein